VVTSFRLTQRSRQQPDELLLGKMIWHAPNHDRRVPAVQFLAPFIMVKKGGKLPEGNINDWFFEKGDLKSSLPGRMPAGASTQVARRTRECCESVHITTYVGSALVPINSGVVIWMCCLSNWTLVQHERAQEFDC